MEGHNNIPEGALYDSPDVKDAVQGEQADYERVKERIRPELEQEFHRLYGNKRPISHAPGANFEDDLHYRRDKEEIEASARNQDLYPED